MLQRMKEQHRKKAIKIALSILVVITIVITLPGLSANNNHDVTESFDGSWRAVAGNIGLYGNAARFRVDGQAAWCLEPRKGAKPGLNQEFNIGDIGISVEQKNVINLITNFGYFTQPTPTNEILTGNLIWRYLGYTCGYVSSSNGFPTMASQQPWFDDVMNKVNRYGLNMSFYNQRYEISVGETIVLDDTNGVLQDMEIISNDGLQVLKSGNQLVVTGTANANDTSTIILKKVVSNETRDFVVRSGGSQALSVCSVNDPLSGAIQFKVNKNYQVAFNGNGASSGSMENQTFLYNQAQSLRANTFTKVGHSFDGWNTAADGSGISYGNQQSVRNLTSANSTITLYAKWLNNQPIIVTPVLPNPNPPGASNIPPLIDGGKLVMQIGDTFEAKKYFIASDIEDGDITSKIVITNNEVPLDKDNNTTTSGDYNVQATVTDSGGLTTIADLTVHVNEPPVLKAEERWFLQDEVVDHNNLMSQVLAEDKEDGNLIGKVVIDYIKYHDGRVVNSPTSFETSFVNASGKDDIKVTTSEIKYTVGDKYGKSVSTTTKLHVSRDIQKFVPKRKKAVRYIDLKSINTLDKTSIWKIDDSYNQRLLSSLKKNDDSQAKVIYRYSSKEIKEVKDWVRTNKQSQQANQAFVNTYLNTHKVSGSLK